LRFKDDDKKDETPPPPPYIIAEGWLRLGIKTPNMEERYPPVLNEDLDHPKFSNFEWVNLKNDT